MNRRVIIGWDGTNAARNALDWALRWWDADRVELVGVGTRDESSAEYFVAGSLAADARIRLMEAAEHAREAHPDKTISSAFEHGDPAEILADLSDPDTCVVLGTNRVDHGRFRYAWSVGTKVAATAKGPVVIVPTFSNTQPTTAPTRQIVVGVDGSIGELELVWTAAEEAERTQCGLTVVHAWIPPVWEAEEALDRDMLHWLAEEHARLLDTTVADVAARYPSITLTKQLVENEPGPAITSAGRQAQLLVLGRHGVSRLRRLFLGSVSHTVLLDIPAPTLVLPLGTVEP